MTDITLAESLERTEQSITLALQEIDRNFAKATHIVTNSILPVIERYGQNSRDLWKNVEFWKRFLEAAGDVRFQGSDADEDEELQIAERASQRDLSSQHHSVNDNDISESVDMDVPEHGTSTELSLPLFTPTALPVAQNDMSVGSSPFNSNLDITHTPTPVFTSRNFNNSLGSTPSIVRPSRTEPEFKIPAINKTPVRSVASRFDSSPLDIPEPPQLQTQLTPTPPRVKATSTYDFETPVPAPRGEALLDLSIAPTQTAYGDESTAPDISPPSLNIGVREQLDMSEEDISVPQRTQLDFEDNKTSQ